jgi:16S rRNA (uracil1498-N3)-methyltransferase
LRCETAATLCLGLHWWGSQLCGKTDAHMEATP